MTRPAFRPQLLIAFCASLSGMAGCGDPVVNHFVVPVGFRGPIAVIAHPRFRVAPESFWPGAGRNVLVVQATGVVCIPTNHIFCGFLTSAEYADGSLLYSSKSPPPSSEAVRISGFGSWGGDIEHEGVSWLGVGSEKEVAELQTAFFSHRIAALMPPGVVMDQTRDFETFERYCASR